MSEKDKVLVVEDNDFVRMQLVSHLKGAGFDVVEASGGEEAFSHMLSDPAIALAVVDVKMEPVGGFEFITALRGERKNTPVILVTGDQTPDILERAGKLGVAAVLMKPVEKDRFIKTVERTIRNSRRG